jgi:hypothetical protein
MRINKAQREGLAKISDNLATACIVAVLVGGVVDHKLGVPGGVFLLSLFVVLVSMGLRLRKNGGQNDD